MNCVERQVIQQIELLILAGDGLSTGSLGSRLQRSQKIAGRAEAFSFAAFACLATATISLG